MNTYSKEHNRLMGAIIGGIIGDCVGVYNEFADADADAYNERMSLTHKTFIPARPTRVRNIDNFKEGQDVFGHDWGYYTDDSSQIRILMEMYTHSGGQTDPGTFLTMLEQWYTAGYMSSTGDCFDIGGQTSKAIRAWVNDPIREYAEPNGWSAGNAALMRLIPSFIADIYHPTEFCHREVIKQTMVTHCDPEAINQSVNMSDILWDIYSGMKQPGIESNYVIQLSENVHPSGFCKDSLDLAMACFMETDTFEEGLFKVVNRGGDSDTIGCIYGQIAGMYYGIDSIPTSMYNDIRHIDDIIKQSCRFITTMENRVKNANV